MIRSSCTISQRTAHKPNDFLVVIELCSIYLAVESAVLTSVVSRSLIPVRVVYSA